MVTACGGGVLHQAASHMDRAGRDLGGGGDAVKSGLQAVNNGSKEGPCKMLPQSASAQDENVTSG